MQASQVKSKQRVSDHGEVFTSSREVEAMLDLVYDKVDPIGATFLEPACGHGNFLIEILNRKLEAVGSECRRSQFDYERKLVEAVSSLYGIDIQNDNIDEARYRLLGFVEKRYQGIFGNRIRQEVLDSARFLFKKNLIWGDALDYTLCRKIEDKPEQVGRPTLESLRNEKPPIIFSEWKFKNSGVQRRDFVFKEVAEGIGEDNPLFPPEAIVFRTVGEFPLVHFTRLSTAYDD
jgi:hypothetical protein